MVAHHDSAEFYPVAPYDEFSPYQFVKASFFDNHFVIFRQLTHYPKLPHSTHSVKRYLTKTT